MADEKDTVHYKGSRGMITMRSNDQFNTTIYGFSDRLRGIEDTRDVLLMNPDDMAAEGLVAGQVVGLTSDAGTGWIEGSAGSR